MDETGTQATGKALTMPERALGGVREALAAAGRQTTLAELLAATDLMICGPTRATSSRDQTPGDSRPVDTW